MGGREEGEAFLADVLLQDMEWGWGIDWVWGESEGHPPASLVSVTCRSPGRPYVCNHNNQSQYSTMISTCTHVYWGTMYIYYQIIESANVSTNKRMD